MSAAKIGAIRASNIKMRYIHRIIFFSLILLIWEIITKLKIYPDYLLPSPKNVFETFVFGFKEASYIGAIAASLKRVLIGYFIAVSLGIVSGFAIARYKILDNTIGSSLVALQAIPSVAWVPFSLLWFGISENAVLFIVILEAFIPCSLGVRTAVLNIPKEIIRAAQTLGSKSLDLYIRVIFPAIIPHLISSLRLSWAFAWRSLIAGELFITGLGIGQTLELGRSLADMPQVLAMIIIIAVLGYASDNLFFRNIEKYIKKLWGQEQA
jgi:NitT/TauT family transport system permease protein